MTDDMTKQFRPWPKPGKKLPAVKKPLPKRSKKNKPATKLEKAHLEWVKSQPCICCCKPPPSIAHHIVEGKRLGHYFTIPLCDLHHKDELGIGKGKLSVHKDKENFIKEFGTELQLLVKFKQRKRDG